MVGPTSVALPRIAPCRQPDGVAGLIEVLAKFGFAHAGATPELLLTPGRVIRMGVPPVRIELLNKVSGLDFSGSYARRVEAVLDGVPVPRSRRPPRGPVSLDLRTS